MSVLRVVLITLALLGCLLPSHTALAQAVPPHSPGTVCYTPQFWCWAQPPGAPGTACACPTPYGWVPGTRG